MSNPVRMLSEADKKPDAKPHVFAFSRPQPAREPVLIKSQPGSRGYSLRQLETAERDEPHLPHFMRPN